MKALLAALRRRVTGQVAPLPIDEIVCGNNVSVLRDFPKDCIDLTVTSPPYDLVDYDDNGRLVTYPNKGLRDYNGYSWDFAALANELWRVTKPGGVVVWVVNDATVDGSETFSSLRQALYFRQIGFLAHDTMIYERPARFPDTTRYYSTSEYMFVFSKGQPKKINLIADKRNSTSGDIISGRDREPNGDLRDKSCSGNSIKQYGVRNNIWRYDAGYMLSTKDIIAFDHPAIFPESLAHDHIISWSNPGDIVLDPFIGSGTTAKMAVKTDRHYIGIDVSEEYCQLARRRIAAVKAQPRLFSWDLQPAVNGDTEKAALFSLEAAP